MKYASLTERLLANSVPVPCPVPGLGECWFWLGSKNNEGYGRLTRRKPTGVHYVEYAHRAALEAFRGEKLQPARRGKWQSIGAHICNVRACINPAHLRSATQKVNILQSVAEGRHSSVIRRKEVHAQSPIFPARQAGDAFSGSYAARNGEDVSDL